MGLGDLENLRRTVRREYIEIVLALLFVGGCGPAIEPEPEAVDTTGTTGASATTGTETGQPEIEEPDPCSVYDVDECPCEPGDCPCKPIWVIDVPNQCEPIPFGCFESSCEDDADCRSWQSCIEVNVHSCPTLLGCGDQCTGSIRQFCLPVFPPSDTESEG
jgi:hypothetical protein